MKYEYGVEYETNGEKPDLAEDVKIEWYSSKREAWFDRCSVGNINWGDPHYLPVDKFRIVDERYKPKVDESNWHERGELPPVGTECEVSNCNQPFTWCEIKYMGSALCVVNHKSHSDQHYHLSSVIFRPITTERDKLVDECAKEMVQSDSPRSAAGKIVDAGYRKIKQQTEGEFMADAQKEIITWNSNDLKKLYRAGCRFIEQGE